jgi:hypothetical protein
MKHIKHVLLIGLIGLCSYTSIAQTAAPPTFPSTSMSPTPIAQPKEMDQPPIPTVSESLDGLWQAISTSTNWYFATYYIHAKALAKPNGWGVGAFYPINPQNTFQVVAGLRLDEVNGHFWMPSGSAALQVPLRLFNGKVILKPLAYVGVGVPLSGATVGGVTIPGETPKDNNGEPTAITGFGLTIKFDLGDKTWAKYVPEIGADLEKWSGFAGTQSRIGTIWHF